MEELVVSSPPFPFFNPSPKGGDHHPNQSTQQQDLSPLFPAPKDANNSLTRSIYMPLSSMTPSACRLKPQGIHHLKASTSLDLSS